MIDAQRTEKLLGTPYIKTSRPFLYARPGKGISCGVFHGLHGNSSNSKNIHPMLKSLKTHGSMEYIIFFKLVDFLMFGMIKRLSM